MDLSISTPILMGLGCIALSTIAFGWTWNVSDARDREHLGMLLFVYCGVLTCMTILIAGEYFLDIKFPEEMSRLREPDAMPLSEAMKGVGWLWLTIVSSFSGIMSFVVVFQRPSQVAPRPG